MTICMTSSHSSRTQFLRTRHRTVISGWTRPNRVAGRGLANTQFRRCPQSLHVPLQTLHSNSSQHKQTAMHNILRTGMPGYAENITLLVDTVRFLHPKQKKEGLCETGQFVNAHNNQPIWMTWWIFAYVYVRFFCLPTFQSRLRGIPLDLQFIHT